jgi:hypothetical protein
MNVRRLGALGQDPEDLEYIGFFFSFLLTHLQCEIVQLSDVCMYVDMDIPPIQLFHMYLH